MMYMGAGGRVGIWDTGVWVWVWGVVMVGWVLM